LLLTARHLLAHDPPRILGWRFLHEEAFAARAAALGPLLPRPSAGLDRDPIALVLAAIAAGLAVVYLVATLARARVHVRFALMTVAALFVVALPSIGLIAMGAATGRPYGQDGGVVQLPLAIDRILSGRSPYGADYSDSMLGRQARVSDFWTEHGGNPILHHHAYLPGTHLLMLPFVPLSRALLGSFDPRVATLVAFALAGLLAYRLSPGSLGLAAAAAVWVSPLVYWQQIFGANDVVVAALVLLAVHLVRAGRAGAAAGVIGLACASKQLAWPFAPFLLAHLSGATSLRGLAAPPARGRLLRALAIACAVFVVVVAPVAALDVRAFWRDIVVYNAGLPGGDNYPLGGTPGLGLANLVVYFGGVSSLRDYVPLGWLYVLLVPAGVWLLGRSLRSGALGDALAAGGAALLLSLYVSRVVHPNYLILAAVLLPAAVVMGARVTIDAVVGGLLLLATAVEIAEGEVFASTWTDAVAAHWPGASVLAPRAGPDLTRDPLGLVFSAMACGLGVALVVAGVARARRRWRVLLGAVALVSLVVVPSWIEIRMGQLSGAPRIEDAWAATVWPRTAGSAPPVLRQAWSLSFRKDPPSTVEPANPAPAAPWLAAMLPAARVHDPRALTLGALVCASLLLAFAAPAEIALVRAAAVVLLPASILGVVFGSGDMVLLAIALAGAIALPRGRPLAAGVVIGLATALFPRLIPAVPLVIVATAPTDVTRRRAAWGAAIGVALGWTAALVAGTVAVPTFLPGFGLSNLRLYLGAMPGTPDLVGPVLVGITALASLVAAVRVRWSPARALAAAAACLIGALWLAPAASPDDVVVPVALLVMAAAWPRPSDLIDSPASAP